MIKVKSFFAPLIFIFVALFGVILTACKNNNNMTVSLSADSVQIILGENDNSATIYATVENAKDDYVIVDYDSPDIQVSTKYIGDGITEITILAYRKCNNVDVAVKGVKKSAHFTVSAVLPISSITPNQSEYYVGYDKVTGSTFDLNDSLFTITPQGASQNEFKYSLMQEIDGVSIANNKLILSPNLNDLPDYVSVEVVSTFNEEAKTTLKINIIKKIDVESILICDESGKEILEGETTFNISRKNSSSAILNLIVRVPFSVSTEVINVIPKFTFEDKGILQQNDTIILKDEINRYYQYSFTFTVDEKNSTPGTDYLHFELSYVKYPNIKSSTADKDNGILTITTYDEITDISCFADDGHQISNGEEINLYTSYHKQNSIDGYSIKFEAIPTTATSENLSLNVNIEDENFKYLIIKNSKGEEIVLDNGKYLFESGERFYFLAKDGFANGSKIEIVIKSEENESISKSFSFVFKQGISEFGFVYESNEILNSRTYYLSSEAGEFSSSIVSFVVNPQIESTVLESESKEGNTLVLQYSTFTITISGDAFKVVKQDLGNGNFAYIKKDENSAKNKYDLLISSNFVGSGEGVINIRFESGQEISAKVIVVTELDNVKIGLDTNYIGSSAIGDIKYDADGGLLYVAVKMGQSLPLVYNSNADYSSISYGFYDIDNNVLEQEDFVHPEDDGLYGINSLTISANYLRALQLISPVEVGKVWVKASFVGKELQLSESGFEILYQNCVIEKYFLVEVYVPITSFNATTKTLELYAYDEVGEFNKELSSQIVTFEFNNGVTLPTYNDIIWDIFGGITLEKNVVYEYKATNSDVVYFTVENLGNRSFKFTALTRNANDKDFEFMPTSLSLYAKDLGLDANVWNYKINLVIKEPVLVEKIMATNVSSDGIYLITPNLKENLSNINGESTYKILTKVEPENALCNEIVYRFIPDVGTPSNMIDITDDGLVTVNGSVGGSGVIKILPKDGIFVDDDGIEYYRDGIASCEIKLVVGDGKTRESSLRISDLSQITNGEFHYTLTQSVDYPTSWKKPETFNGGLYGRELDSQSVATITLNGQNLFDILGASGILEDLTICGISYAQSMVVNINNGVIKNVSVDVYQQDGAYNVSSVQTTSESAGGIANQNNGQIVNCTFAGSITVENSNGLIGGITAINSGAISNSKVLIYNMPEGTNSKQLKFDATNIGGLVGDMRQGAKLVESYVYNFSENLTYGDENIGALVYMISSDNVLIEKCFAEIGQPIEFYKEFTATKDISLIIKDSYVLSKTKNAEAENGYDLSFAYFITQSNGRRISGISENASDSFLNVAFGNYQIWNRDSSTNYGFPYLTNVVPPKALTSLELQNFQIQNSRLSFAQSDDYAVMFFYKTNNVVLSDEEKRVLNLVNSISFAELFAVDKTDGLLISSKNVKIIDIKTNQIQIKDTGLVQLEIKSKYDLTIQPKIINVYVIYATNNFTLNYKGQNLLSDATINIKNGISENIISSLDSSIVLTNRALSLMQNNFEVVFEQNGDKTGYVVGGKIGTHSVASTFYSDGQIVEHVDFEVYLKLLDVVFDDSSVADNVQNIVKQNTLKKLRIQRTFGAISVSSSINSVNMTLSDEISAQITATFDTNYTSKNVNIEIYNSIGEDVRALNIFEEIKLDDVTSDEENNVTTYVYNIVIKLNSNLNTAQIDPKGYKIRFIADEFVYADIKVNIITQEILRIEINNYAQKSSNQTGSSYNYFPNNVLSPGTSGLLDIMVYPAYASYTHLTVTAEPVNNQSLQLISMKKIEDSNAYVVNDASKFEFIKNGVKVYAKQETNEISRYYVRALVSANVALNSVYNIVVNAYNGDELVYPQTYSLIIVPQEKAGITVNGQNKIFAVKGETLTAEIVYEQTQEIDSIVAYEMNTENVNDSIVIINNNDFESYATKYYKGTVQISIGNNAVHADIRVTTSRLINGVMERVYSVLKIYILDFEIDSANIHIKNEMGSDTATGNKYFYSDLDFNIAGKYVAGTSSENAYQTFIKNNYYRNSILGYEVNYNTTNRETLLENLYYVNGDEISPVIIKNPNGTTSVASSDIVADFVVDEVEQNGQTSKVIKFIGKNNGTQNMLLEIKAKMPDGSIVTYRYFFDIVIANYVSEEEPSQISNQEEFLQAFNQDVAQDYILMNDIVLYDYVPIEDTSKVLSLDGNGHSIVIRSFADEVINQSSVNLTLFQNVSSTTLIKNLRVNIYHVDNININSDVTTQLNVAPIAINNSGIITNTEVVSYKYLVNQIISQVNGISITTDSTLNITAYTAGFVLNNAGIITNSRVGGESLNVYTVNERGTVTYKTIDLEPFVISSFGEIGGFVHTNTGSITSSYVSNLRLINNSNIDYTTISSGFAVANTGSISMSYSKGVKENPMDIHATQFGIETSGISSGFVYVNSGSISNSYSNITMTNSANNPGRTSAGFVYNNQTNGIVKTSLSLSRIVGATTTQMNFSGVDDWGNWQNFGKIENSYYYDKVATEDSSILIEEAYGESASNISSVTLKEYLYGFIFTTNEQNDDGVWAMTATGPELVTANTPAVSLRYAVENENSRPIFSYASNYEYGSKNNPILIKNAQEFNNVFSGTTGTSASKFVSITDKQAFGNYRLVSDINLMNLSKNQEEQSYRLASSSLTLTGSYREQGNKNGLGKFDGNGFTISGFSLSDSFVESSATDFGMFASIENGAILMNLNIEIGTTNEENEIFGVEAKNIKYVGALAGTVKDSKVVNVELSSVLNNSNSVTVRGKNIVGGIIGRVIGNSYISNLTSTNVSVTAAKFPDNVYDGASYTTYNSYSRTNENQNNNISYAGGIVGIIDIYTEDTILNENFADTIVSTNGNAVMLKTLGISQISAGTVGGVAGYVGPLTIMQDALYELSYLESVNYNMQGLYSYNGFAGGIVGYNKGYLRQVRAEHAQNWQIDIIEDNIDEYYGGDYSVDRGNTQLFISSGTKPIAIGGLVGLSVSGKVEKSYSKLNTINTTAKYAGGIIGINEKPATSLIDYIKLALNEVYAMGDVMAQTSAGIVGLNKGGFDFDKVNAVNYWGNQLIDDNNTYVTYAISYDKNSVDSYKKTYAFNNENIMFNGMAADGNRYILNNNGSVSVILGLYNVTGVGDDGELFDNYFTGNEWESQTWERNENELFPHIVFGYISKIRYIRNQNDIDLLRIATKDDIFVIYPDDSKENEDNMIGITKRIAPITNFSGTLRSIDSLNPSGFLFKVNQNRALFSSTSNATFYNFIVKYDDEVNFNGSLAQNATLVNAANDTTFNNLTFQNITMDVTTASSSGIVSAVAKGTTLFSNITIESSVLNLNDNSTQQDDSAQQYNAGLLFGSANIANSSISGGIFDTKIAEASINLGRSVNVNYSNFGLIGGTLACSSDARIPIAINRKISGNITMQEGSYAINSNIGFLFGYTNNVQIECVTSVDESLSNQVQRIDSAINSNGLIAFSSVGGVVGNAERTDLKNIVMYPNINLTYMQSSAVGGMVGKYNGGEVNNCKILTNENVDTSANANDEPLNQLSITNINSTSAVNNIGSLIGDSNNVQILNCSSYLNISAQLDSQSDGGESELTNYIGGLVGNSLNLIINNSVYYGNLNYKSRNAQNANSVIEDNTFIGGILANGESSSIGEIPSTDENTTSQNVYSTGNITNWSKIDSNVRLNLTISGIVAKMKNGTISNSVSLGNTYPSYYEDDNDGINKSNTEISNKITNFTYGGVLGVANGSLTLKDNYSLNTLFNKLDQQLSSESYNVNSIVGNDVDASVINFKDNEYATNIYAHVYTLTTDESYGKNSLLSYVLSDVRKKIQKSGFLDDNIIGDEKSGNKLYPYTSLGSEESKYYYLGDESQSYSVNLISKNLENVKDSFIVADGAQIIFDDPANNSPFEIIDKNSVVAGIVVLANYYEDGKITEGVVSGFADVNNGIIYSCNTRGRKNENNFKITGSITTNRPASGFVYQNSGLIKECYSNLDVVSYYKGNASSSGNNSNKVAVAGFVIENNDGIIYDCYSAGSIQNYNPNNASETFNLNMYLFGPGKVYNSFSITRLIDGDLLNYYSISSRKFAFGKDCENCFYDKYACEARLSSESGGEQKVTEDVSISYIDISKQFKTSVYANSKNLKINTNYNYGYGSFVNGAYGAIEYMHHATGTGEDDDYFQVPNLGKLMQISSNTNETNTSETNSDKKTYYVLVNNINAEYLTNNFSDYWESQDIENVYLTGLDNVSSTMHYIKNLKSRGGGIFNQVTNSYIYNIILENIETEITSIETTAYVGFLANKANSSEIKNIEIRTSASSTDTLTIYGENISEIVFGNIIGKLGDGSTLEACDFVSLNTSSASQSEYIFKLRYNLDFTIGGMVGELNGDNATITNSSITKTIYIDYGQEKESNIDGNTIIVGGIVGRQVNGKVTDSYLNRSLHLFDGKSNEVQNNNVSMQDVYSNVSNLTLYAGGIVGYSDEKNSTTDNNTTTSNSIEKCYILSGVDIIAGNHFSFKTSYVGGICGYGGNIINCYSKANSVIGYATYQQSKKELADFKSIDGFLPSDEVVYSRSGLPIYKDDIVVYKTVTQEAYVSGIANAYNSVSEVVNYCDTIQGGMQSRNLYAYYDTSDFLKALWNSVGYGLFSWGRKILLVHGILGGILMTGGLAVKALCPVTIDRYYFDGNGYNYTENYFDEIPKEVWKFDNFSLTVGTPSYITQGNGFNEIAPNIKSGSSWNGLFVYENNNKKYYYTESEVLYIQDIYFDSIGFAKNQNGQSLTTQNDSSLNTSSAISVAGQVLEEIQINNSTYYAVNDNGNENGQGNVFDSYGLVYSTNVYNKISKDTTIQNLPTDWNWEQCQDGTWVPSGTVEVSRTSLGEFVNGNTIIDDNHATFNISTVEEYRMLSIIINELPSATDLSDFVNDYAGENESSEALISYLEKLQKIIQSTDEASYTINFVPKNGKNSINLINVNPLGTSEYPFNGEFVAANRQSDLGYFTLNEIKTAIRGDNNSGGIFGNVKYLKLSNLNISYSSNNTLNSNSNSSNIGGIVGVANENAKIDITNAMISFNIDGEEQSMATDTTNNNTTTLISPVVGYMQTGSSLAINNVIVEGNISTVNDENKSNVEYVGAIVGHAVSSTFDISEVSAQLEINSSSYTSIVGGLFGKIEDSDITLKDITLQGNITSESAGVQNEGNLAIAAGVIGELELTKNANYTFENVYINFKEISAKASAKNVTTYAAGLIGYISEGVNNIEFDIMNLNIGYADYYTYQNKSVISSGLNAKEYSNKAYSDIYIGNRINAASLIESLQNNSNILVNVSCLSLAKPSYEDLPVDDTTNLLSISAKTVANEFEKSNVSLDYSISNLKFGSQAMRLEVYECETKFNNSENSYINGEQYVSYAYTTNYYIIATSIAEMIGDGETVEYYIGEKKNDGLIYEIYDGSIYEIEDRIYRLKINGQNNEKNDFDITDSYELQFVRANVYTTTKNPYANYENTSFDLNNRYSDFMPKDLDNALLKEDSIENNNSELTTYKYSRASYNDVETFDNSNLSKYSVKENRIPLNLSVSKQKIKVDGINAKIETETLLWNTIGVTNDSEKAKLMLNYRLITDNSSGNADIENENMTPINNKVTTKTYSKVLCEIEKAYSCEGEWNEFGKVSFVDEKGASIDANVNDLYKETYNYSFNVKTQGTDIKLNKDITLHNDKLDSGIIVSMGSTIKIDSQSATYQTLIISTKLTDKERAYRDFVYVIKGDQIASLGYIEYTLYEGEITAQTPRNSMFFPDSPLIVNKYENHLISLSSIKFSSLNESFTDENFEYSLIQKIYDINYVIEEDASGGYQIKTTSTEKNVENTFTIYNINYDSGEYEIKFKLTTQTTKKPSEEKIEYSVTLIDNEKGFSVINNAFVDGEQANGFVVNSALDGYSKYYYFEYTSDLINVYELTKINETNFEKNGEPMAKYELDGTSASETKLQYEDIVVTYYYGTNSTYFKIGNGDYYSLAGIYTLSLEQENALLVLASGNKTYKIDLSNDINLKVLIYNLNLGDGYTYTITENYADNLITISSSQNDKTINVSWTYNNEKQLSELTGTNEDFALNIVLKGTVDEKPENKFIAVYEKRNEKSIFNISTDLSNLIYEYINTTGDVALYLKNATESTNAINISDYETLIESSNLTLFKQINGEFVCISDLNVGENFSEYTNTKISGVENVFVKTDDSTKNIFDYIQISFDNGSTTLTCNLYIDVVANESSSTINVYNYNSIQDITISLEYNESIMVEAIHYSMVNINNNGEYKNIIYIKDYNTVLRLNYQASEFKLIPFNNSYAICINNINNQECFTLEDGYLINTNIAGGAINTSVAKIGNEPPYYYSFGIKNFAQILYNCAQYTTSSGEVINVNEYVFVKNQINLENVENSENFTIVGTASETTIEVSRKIVDKDGKYQITDIVTQGENKMQYTYTMNLGFEILYINAETPSDDNQQNLGYKIETITLYYEGNDNFDITNENGENSATKLQRSIISIGSTSFDVVFGIVETSLNIDLEQSTT